ncbi:MAG: TRAP transporter large permease [Clostridiales bacterium]|nr:TRAP transporter large permease [Clostridiales bacterium]
MNTTILFVALVVAVLLYVPIAFAIGIGCSLIAVFTSDISIRTIFSGLYTSGDQFALLAVPFFILAGDIMASCGISRRLVNLAKTLIGHVTGGMGMVTVIACMFFAAISGSGVATAAAVGGIMIPILKQDNYKDEFSTALVSTASAVGPIIPPSVPMIILGILCSISVTDLFIAGVVPGVLISLALMVAVGIISRRRGYGQKREKASWKERLRAIWDAKFSIIMPVIILGGIYSGMFTPTEASVVACAYSLVIGLFVYREIKLRDLVPIIGRAARNVGIIMALLGFAQIFGKVLVLQKVPATLAAWVQQLTNSKILVLFVVNIILLIAGMFLETGSAITILGPLLFAIVTPYGVKPLHLAIIMIVNLAIGLATPPVGASLFVSAGISKIPVERTMKDLLILIGVCFAVLLLITYCEPIVTFLPALLKR